MKRKPVRQETKPAVTPKAALKQEKAEGKKHLEAIKKAVAPKKKGK